MLRPVFCAVPDAEAALFGCVVSGVFSNFRPQVRQKPSFSATGLPQYIQKLAMTFSFHRTASYSQHPTCRRCSPESYFTQFLYLRNRFLHFFAFIKIPGENPFLNAYSRSVGSSVGKSDSVQELQGSDQRNSRPPGRSCHLPPFCRNE